MARWSLLAALLALPPAGGCGAKSELWVDEAPPDAAADDAVADDGGRGDDGTDRGTDDAAPDDGPTEDVGADDGAADEADGPIDRVLPVASSNDDALQDPGGPMLVAYAWISLYSPEHRGGLRFVLDDVPRHATLLEATLEVYVDSGAEGDPAEAIHRQTGPDPEAFMMGSGDLSRRPLSIEAVRWYDVGLPEGWTVSPSLVPLLQPLLDEDHYSPGDAVVLIIVPGPEAGPGRVFEFRQFDHPGGDFDPRLRLRYLPP